MNSEGIEKKAREIFGCKNFCNTMCENISQCKAINKLVTMAEWMQEQMIEKALSALNETYFANEAMRERAKDRMSKAMKGE